MAGTKKSHDLESNNEDRRQETNMDKTKPGEELEESEDEKLFKDLPPKEKAIRVVSVIARLILFLGCLYIFICSLGLLEAAFQLVGGRTAGRAFSSGLLSNPFAGLMVGVLATVLVQSSSTSTSIVVTMVGSSIITVENAVPIVMGANIGTSVTNTLVSLAQATRRDEFKRAFAGATVHDMFNWLSVLVLLPLEIGVGFLHWLSGKIVDSMGLEGGNEKTPDMLKAITKPLITSIVKVNKDVIKDVAANSNKSDGDVLVRWCKSEKREVTVTKPKYSQVSVDCSSLDAGADLYDVCQQALQDSNTSSANTSFTVSWNTTEQVVKSFNLERCPNLLAHTDLSDAVAGALLLISSLVLILGMLMMIVRILHSMLSGSVSKVIKRTINADFPSPFGYFTGYAALLVGAGMTVIVQSSSVFTSTLTPLVGVGIVSVERMYPMTLGSNVGTTVTAILAALSQSGSKLRNSIQIAMCHLFFNISGILIFYPIPFMRWPIALAKILGRKTSKYRWFAIFYLIMMFVILPGLVFGLSFAGWIYLAAIGGPMLFVFLATALINVLQVKRPTLLPSILRTWEFLPEWMHSLKPVDRLISRVFICGYCQNLQKMSAEDELIESTDEDRIESEEDNVRGTSTAKKTDSVNGELKELKPTENGMDNLAFQSDTKF